MNHERNHVFGALKLFRLQTRLPSAAFCFNGRTIRSNRHPDVLLTDYSARLLDSIVLVSRGRVLSRVDALFPRRGMRCRGSRGDGV